jgi:hypothetical protein
VAITAASMREAAAWIREPRKSLPEPSDAPCKGDRSRQSADRCRPSWPRPRGSASLPHTARAP